MNIWTGVLVTGLSLIALVVTVYIASLSYFMTATQAHIYILLGLLELTGIATGLFGITSWLTDLLFTETTT